MDEPLIYGSIRKLWVGEAELYRGHLLRLDGESRRNRFGGAVSDEFIGRYCEPFALGGAILYGFFVDGVLRGAAELRLLDSRMHGNSADAVVDDWAPRAAHLRPSCHSINPQPISRGPQPAAGRVGSADAFASSIGMRTSKTVPQGALARAESCPPSLSSIGRQIASPIPIPPGLVL